MIYRLLSWYRRWTGFDKSSQSIGRYTPIIWKP
jgi:hypothetical protein